MKKLVLAVVLLVLISPISFALEAGRLWINDVEIPYIMPSIAEAPGKDIAAGFEPKPTSTFYIYANGQRIAKKENNKLYYFYNDHLGSPRAISDDEGNIIWKGDYLPFGEVFNEQGDNNVKYNSKELDFDTKLHYYGQRYYLDELGRFITADIVEMYPNAYVYVANNPMGYVDPSGEQKKYSLILPAVSRPYEINKETKYIISGLALTSLDTLDVFLVGNQNAGKFSESSSSIEYNFKNLQQISIIPNVAINKEIISEILIESNIIGSISVKFMNLNNWDEMPQFIEKISKESDEFFTGGHGSTNNPNLGHTGFRTLSPNNNIHGGSFFDTTWEEYLTNPKWTDLSCGSTCPADTFSHKKDDPNTEFGNADSLVRYLHEISGLVKNRKNVKETLTNYYLKKEQ